VPLSSLPNGKEKGEKKLFYSKKRGGGGGRKRKGRRMVFLTIFFRKKKKGKISDKGEKIGKRERKRSVHAFGGRKGKGRKKENTSFDDYHQNKKKKIGRKKERGKGEVPSLRSKKGGKRKKRTLIPCGKKKKN